MRGDADGRENPYNPRPASTPRPQRTQCPGNADPFRDTQLARTLCIADLREIARRRMPHFAFEYVEGGAEDEATLRANRSAFEDWRFVPQTLVDTTARHHRVTLFGKEIPAPLIIAPTGMNGILNARTGTSGWHARRRTPAFPSVSARCPRRSSRT